MNFAVLASGNGSNLQAIIRAVKRHKIHGKLKVVVSDKMDAYALTRARRAKVPMVVSVNPEDFCSREAFDEAVIRILQREEIKLVVLAGFMRILSPVFIKAFHHRIINVHPALLPAFKGGKALQDALAYGAKVTGVTVHFVDEQVDHGAIIAQVPVVIKPKDTPDSLAQRIHRVEHVLYPHVIDLFLRGRLKIVGRKVLVG